MPSSPAMLQASAGALVSAAELPAITRPISDSGIPARSIASRAAFAPSVALLSVAASSANAYACPNVATRDRQRRLNIPSPGSMRAPGVAQGNFALESALDELSYALGLDPVQLRLRNDARSHPQSGLPWSSRAMGECYAVGAERFGWSRRDPHPGSMRDGRWLVGYGVAAAGQAALHGMLTSCAAGVVVVNIDNGFGAAAAAARMLRRPS